MFSVYEERALKIKVQTLLIKHESPQSSDRGLSYIAWFMRIRGIMNDYYKLSVQLRVACPVLFGA